MAGLAALSDAAGEATKELWIVRHGERVDETAGAAAWKLATPRCRHFDPPLTAAGAEQSRVAAEFLTRDQPAGGFDRIFCSPCARTLGTAQELSSALGGLPVTVVPALAACAAAVKKHGLDRLPFLAAKEMGAICPALDTVVEDAPRGFEAACEWLAARADRRNVLVVSHREGIRDLARERLKLPYCAIANFTAHTDEGHFDWVLKTLHAPTGKLLLAR